MLATGGLRAPVTQPRSSCVLTMTCYPRLRLPPGQNRRTAETLSFCNHPLWGQSVRTQSATFRFHTNQLTLHLRVTLRLCRSIRSLKPSEQLCLATEQVAVDQCGRDSLAVRGEFPPRLLRDRGKAQLLHQHRERRRNLFDDS